MISLGTHVLLFLVLSLPIVLMGAFYADPDDASALRSVPRRYAFFIAACALVAVVMLVLEALFVSVS